MTLPSKLTYSDKLNRLEKQYDRLLVSNLEHNNHVKAILV